MENQINRAIERNRGSEEKEERLIAKLDVNGKKNTMEMEMEKQEELRENEKVK